MNGFPAAGPPLGNPRASAGSGDGSLEVSNTLPVWIRLDGEWLDASIDGSSLKFGFVVSDASLPLCSGSRVFVVGWFLIVLDLFDRISELFACSVESASNRADGQLKNFGDFFVRRLVHFSQYQNITVLVTEPLHCRPNQVDLVVSDHRRVDRLSLVHDVIAHFFALLIEGDLGAFATFSRQCDIEGDSIQPSEKLTVLLERIQFHESTNEGFLRHLFRIMDPPAHVSHRRKQATLMLMDQ